MIKSQRQKGFTLIEMMVVLVLISIIVAVTVVSLNTDDIKEHMEIEMVRLQTLVNLAQEEAILQGQVMALAISENTYRFDKLDVESGKWSPVDNSKVFRERTIVPGTTFALVIDNIKLEEEKEGFKLELSSEEKVKDKTESDEEEEEEDKYKRVHIEPSGEMFPFELIMRNEDETIEFKLVLDEDGELKVVLPEDFS